jgi:myo-inositol-hexaphosphate 3-phosphohydrolase
MKHLIMLCSGMVALVLATSCQPIQPMADRLTEVGSVALTEAIDISEPELLSEIPIVHAALETQPIWDTEDELPTDARFGDADDPAIWLHPTDPNLSIVVAALKEGGLDVYDLDGALLQELQPDGVRYNNVDIIYGFLLGDQESDLIVATDRYGDRLAIFRVDPHTRQLTDVTDPNNPMLFTPEGQESDGETTAYGIALYRSPQSGKFYAFANRRDTGELAQWELLDNGQGQTAIRRVRDLSLPIPEGGEPEDAQTEGMVVDEEMGVLYVGQEDVGVWQFDAEPDGSSEGALIHAVRPQGEILEPDVEGLTIYYGPDGRGYLLVSSQGDNTFAVFDREGDHAYLGSFQIGAMGEVDGVQESDGAMVLNVALGDLFPNGLLVVQDGFNLPAFMVEDDGELENVVTNFKYVDWAEVANAFDPPLLIDTVSYHPRR